MTYLKKIILSCISLVTFNMSYADNNIGAAIAAAMTTQTVNTGSMVYMKNHGMNPQYVSTPYGGYVVPGPATKAPAATATTATQQPQTPYEAQNKQQNKTQFVNGNVAQAFPMAQPTITAQPAMAGQQSVTQPAVVGLQPVTMVQPAMGTLPVGVVQSSASNQPQAVVAQSTTSQSPAMTAQPAIGAQQSPKSPIMVTQQAQ
jgi:hypothetical protein